VIRRILATACGLFFASNCAAEAYKLGSVGVLRLGTLEAASVQVEFELTDLSKPWEAKNARMRQKFFYPASKSKDEPRDDFTSPCAALGEQEYLEWFKKGRGGGGPTDENLAMVALRCGQSGISLMIERPNAPISLNTPEMLDGQRYFGEQKRMRAAVLMGHQGAILFFDWGSVKNVSAHAKAAEAELTRWANNDKAVQAYQDQQRKIREARWAAQEKANKEACASACEKAP
jgi:hypothetical protein